MKTIGITGYKGKIGSLLIRRANFVSLDCDITNIQSVEKAITGAGKDLDLIVNCAGVADIEECANNFPRAIEVNVRGLHNIHKVFGSRVVNISSDMVFSGKSWWLPSEETKKSPINSYGFTKVGGEAISGIQGGKTIRLSRTVSVWDTDIRKYLHLLSENESVSVPTFFHRNYVHRKFAVDGIEWFANNFDEMPEIVNYGGLDNFSMYEFVLLLARKVYGEKVGVLPNDNYVVRSNLSPRPKRGGFKVSLASKLNFPMYSLEDTLEKLFEEFHA